ncbi:MAG: hypothetical protein U0840_29105 [Gemmataceae bacterium]
MLTVNLREAFLSLHQDRSLTAQRVHDLLAIVAQLGEDVEAVGIGKGATVVLHAAVLSPRITAVQLERGLVSWSNVVETPLTVDQLTRSPLQKGERVAYLSDGSCTVAMHPGVGQLQRP